MKFFLKLLAPVLIDHKPQIQSGRQLEVAVACASLVGSVTSNEPKVEHRACPEKNSSVVIEPRPNMGRQLLSFNWTIPGP